MSQTTTTTTITESLIGTEDDRIYHYGDFEKIERHQEELKSFLELYNSADKKRLVDFQPGSCSHVVPMSLWEEIFAIVLLLVWPGCLLWVWVPLIWIVYNFVSNITSIYAGGLFLLIVYLAFGPVQWYWKAAIHSKITHLFCSYFSIKGVWEEPLEPEKYAYILVGVPHGVFPFGNMLHLAFWDVFAKFHFSGAAASVLYYIPIMRHVLLWMGCITANYHDIFKALSSGKSVGIASGGIAELFESNKDIETIIIRKRKGFIKLAMQTGAKIVPCYLFGNTQALHCFSDEGRRMQWFSRKIKASITFFWGRFGLPIAYRTPILGVMGRHMTVPKVQEIDEKVVDEIHSEFIERLEEIFEKHKHAYGWGHKKLIIK